MTFDHSTMNLPPGNWIELFVDDFDVSQSPVGVSHHHECDGGIAAQTLRAPVVRREIRQWLRTKPK